MAAAVKRIVVQVTAQEKRTIVAKAKRFDMPVSELMRRGAFAYQSNESDADWACLPIWLWAPPIVPAQPSTTR